MTTEVIVAECAKVGVMLAVKGVKALAKAHMEKKAMLEEGGE